MKILFLCQYFPPESNAPAIRVSEMARYWAKKGHEVHVLTAFPHHPTGVKPPEYAGRLFQRQTWNGINVTRTAVFATPNKGVFVRAIAYVSWMFSSILMGGPMTVRPDVVIATTPQILAAVAGLVLARAKRVPFVLEVRDLWPDSIEAVGAVKSRTIIRILRVLERALYRAADRIVIVSPSFRDHIRQWARDDQIIEIPNGVDLSIFDGRKEDEVNHLYRALGVEEPIRVLYSGTIGLAHALEIVLDAAELLIGQQGRIAFVLAGDGARREELEAEAKRRGLANVHFLGMQPRERLPRLISSSTMALVHLRDSPLFETVLPSKLFEYMGCATPVLMGVRGPGARIVVEAGCGWTFESENAGDLARLVEQVSGDPVEAARRGLRGRRYVEHGYTRENLADRYLGEVLSPLSKRTLPG